RGVDDRLPVRGEVRAGGAPDAVGDALLVGAVQVHRVDLVELVLAPGRLEDEALPVRREVGLAVVALEGELFDLSEVLLLGGLPVFVGVSALARLGRRRGRRGGALYVARGRASRRGGAHVARLGGGGGLRLGVLPGGAGGQEQGAKQASCSHVGLHPTTV